MAPGVRPNGGARKGNGSMDHPASTTKARLGLRCIALLALVGMFSLLLAPLAGAENIVNNISVGGNDTITAGGSTSVNYRVTGPGNNGCDTADGTKLTITLSVPA